MCRMHPDGPARGRVFAPAPALALIFPILVAGCPAYERNLSRMAIPDTTGQVLLVLSPSMDAPRGTMHLFERRNGSWREVRGAVKVALGRNGMGWGLGLSSTRGEGPLKSEGDGRSPAGAFELGEVFGYSAAPPPGTLMPYRPIGPDDYFIDDPGSPDYNSWIKLSPGEDPEKRWKSYEKMRREDGLYEYGIVVKHNMAPVVSGRGSAIFIHVSRGRGKPTAGCTALSREELRDLIAWLDPVKKPILVQLPESELESFSLHPAAR